MHAVLLLLRVPLHFQLLSVERMVVLLLIFEHLLVHGILVGLALTRIGRLQLAHVVQLSPVGLIRHARIQSKSAALLRDQLRGVVALAHVLLLVRGRVGADHAGGQVARSAVGVEAARRTLWANDHVSGALGLGVLLLHRNFLLLHHLLLQVWMHLCYRLALLLWDGPRVATLAWMLHSLRRGRHMTLLMLFFRVVIIAIIYILDIHNILVFFVLSVIVVTEQVVVTRVYTHHS